MRKEFILVVLVLLFASCLRQRNNEELDIIGTNIEYTFEPETKDIPYRVNYTNEIGSLVSVNMQPGQTFYQRIQTNQTMGFKNADILVYNGDSQKKLVGNVSLKRKGEVKTSQTITIGGGASWKFTDYVYK